jgi:hypothetical protein
MKLVEQMDAGDFIPPKEAAELMEIGFSILEQAALKKKEINMLYYRLSNK